MARDGSARQTVPHRIPPWLSNLMVFGLLFIIVVAYFFFQTRQAQEAFLADARAHAQLVADTVRLHARGAVLSHRLMDEILGSFLGNTARFVEYLDAIEPFQPRELAAFAQESGLSGVRIVRADGTLTQGPANWDPAQTLGCGELDTVIHVKSMAGVAYAHRLKNGGGCIVVGMDTRRVDQLQREVGLPRVLDAVAALPGMRYARLSEPVGPDTHGVPIATSSSDTPGVVSLRSQDGAPVAEVSSPFGASRLVIGMDARPLSEIESRLWREFGWFTAVLAVTGAVLSRLLYRRQLAHLKEVQAYERRLSQQREEASLGRAAAAIAHEIRNPLNAMAMGLQRLQMEAAELSEVHRELVNVVLDALKRTNGAVTGLLDYARPYRLNPRAVRLERLFDELLTLYQRRLAEMRIEVHQETALDEEVKGDPDLLRQMLDNLLRNAIEAQPQGGFVTLRMENHKQFVRLILRNGGFHLTPQEAARIFEPYFTTKTRGTGLGLAISRRIVAIHGGQIEARVPAAETLEVSVSLPKSGPPVPGTGVDAQGIAA